MKQRRSFRILSLAIALILLFSALPYLAAAPSRQVKNFEYVGFDASEHVDLFRWDTVAGNDDIQMQMRGGGITDTWLSLSIFTVSHSNGKTTVGVAPLQNVPGTQIEYRAKVGIWSWSDVIALSFDD